MNAFIQRHTFAATMFAASVFIGMETGGYQYIVLKVAEEYGMTQRVMGMMISLHFIAATIMPPLIGPLSDQIGKKKTTILGCLFYLAGAAVCCFVPSQTGFAVGIFGAGSAFGSLLTTCQAALSDAHPGEGGKYVSLFQGTLGIGCVVIPLVLAFLMEHAGCSWRILFAICGGGFLLVMIAAAQVRFPDIDMAGRETALAGENLRERHVPVVSGALHGLLTIFLMGTMMGILIYMFCETTLTFFMDSFFSMEFHEPGYSAAALSCFWTGLAVIRFLANRFYRFAPVLIPLLMMGSAGVMAAFALNHNPAAAVVLAGMAGLLFGPVWPFLLGIATDCYPERTGTVTGMVMLVDGGGGALAPVLIGLISDLTGLRAAFGLVSILMITGAVAYVLMVSGKLRRAAKTPAKRKEQVT